MLDGLECILQLAPGHFDTTPEIVPFLATGRPVGIQLVSYDALLFLGVVNLLAILDPEVGLYGNSHFMFSDLNNVAVADQMSQFLNAKGLDIR